MKQKELRATKIRAQKFAISAAHLKYHLGAMISLTIGGVALSHPFASFVYCNMPYQSRYLPKDGSWDIVSYILEQPLQKSFPSENL